MITGAWIQTRQHLLPVLTGDQPPAFRPGNQYILADALVDFVRSSQTWSSERVQLPARLRRTLWTMVLVQLAWGTWLTLITTGVTSCGPICTAATLDHHVALLVLCSACLAGLLGLAPFTRGLSQANGLEVLSLGVAMAAGAAALLGIAALAVAVLVAALVLLVFLTAFTFDT